MEDFNSKYTGEQVEAILDSVVNGEAGGDGGGGITVERDPVFSASPAASITEEKKSEWDGKYTKPSGGIPASDLASDVFLQGEKGEQGEQGPKGDDGVGIASVVQTTTSSTDGGGNVMTVTLSNGTKSTFTVKNGSKGSQGEQGPKGDQGEQGIQGERGPKGDKGDTGTNGTNGKDGADGEDGATFTPSVDTNGNLSWTNNKGLSNPPTVNIKGPKGDSGEGGGSSDSARKEVIYMDLSSGPIEDMIPNVVYWADGVREFTIESFQEPIAEKDTYDVFTVVLSLGASANDTVSLTLPDYIFWANGVYPEIGTGLYELSISRISDGYGYDRYSAVLTTFKEVE